VTNLYDNNNITSSTSARRACCVLLTVLAIRCPNTSGRRGDSTVNPSHSFNYTAVRYSPLCASQLFGTAVSEDGSQSGVESTQRQDATTSDSHNTVHGLRQSACQHCRFHDAGQRARKEGLITASGWLGRSRAGWREKATTPENRWTREKRRPALCMR
jgi:hypothetical protein